MNVEAQAPFQGAVTSTCAARADGVSEEGRSEPLVSCILVAGDEPRLVGQAVWYFLRQDYKRRELVIVNETGSALDDILPRDPRVRLVSCPSDTSSAAKWDEAYRVAGGDLIASWDVAAWYGPHRLSVQMSRMAEVAAAATAFTGVFHYQPPSGRAWRHLGSPGRHAAATVVYRREAHPLDERATEFDIIDGSNHAVVVLPSSRTGAVNPDDPSWQALPFSEVRRVIDLDMPFYTRTDHLQGDLLRSGRTRPVTVAGTFMVYDGYGSMAEYLALGLAQAGADVRVLPLRIDAAGISDELRGLVERSQPDPCGVVLCHVWWGENLARFGSATDLFIKTVWESSRLPVDWPERLNQTRAVIVPSRWAARVFRESGVTVPVEVVHEGVDPDIYHYVDRSERPGCTTLIVGVLAARKNFREAIAAWKLAFRDDPEARLVLKARFQLEPYVDDDPRVRVVDVNETSRGIKHWYQGADILLALGNEGFGLPLVEGMATGLPVVALNSEAQGDICTEAAGMVISVPPQRWEQVDNPIYGPCGVRAIPDVHAAAAGLRWVADHPAEAREMGRRASQWVHGQRNVWRMGPDVLSVIERHAATKGPLRRTNAVWAPLATLSTGYRLYTEGLLRHLRHTLLHETPPHAWRARTVHVQHVPGTFHDIELVRQLQLARRDGASVVVTSHSPGEWTHAWEKLADALVALDDTAASRLRARWPGRLVEVIPPGMPTWCEPARTGSDATLAVIGTADERTVNDVVSLPGVRIVAMGEDTAATLIGYAAMSPVPASGDALARQLNRVADAVLVLGGDEDAHHVARSALASGVPVLMPHASDSLAATGAVLRPLDAGEAVREVLRMSAVRAELTSQARELCESNAWRKVAELHHALWLALEA